MLRGVRCPCSWASIVEKYHAAELRHDCANLKLPLLRPVANAAAQLQAVRRPQQRQQMREECQRTRLWLGVTIGVGLG